ncbi:axonemal dynein light intermediate polypeptide 1-like isoform X1 [Cimex lectularius]|uniref:Axonemal dynein light chain n=1 Tax=Cimex lectularius TaxID=79782 RepID=A0A8I6RYV2_CIMLE|nr:axonemal dynein light intermediate polypeptide 1-like isoform X1 [Cimex lectularius]
MSQKLITEEQTLLKFSEPFIVKNENEEKQNKCQDLAEMEGTDILEPKSKCFLKSKMFSDKEFKFPPFWKKKKVSSLVTDISSETRPILDVIAYPREWKEGDLTWRQEVSMDQFTRSEVLKLHENLDLRLKERCARGKGICAVRMELFAQVFDELIRQVTLNCLERGMLLLRIRDEYNLTLSVHQALCEGSTSFGARKANLAEEDKNKNHNEIEKVKAEIAAINKNILDMDSKFLMLERRAEELRATQEKNHINEINFLKKTNQQLKAQLESIAAPKK